MRAGLHHLRVRLSAGLVAPESWMFGALLATCSALPAADSGAELQALLFPMALCGAWFVGGDLQPGARSALPMSALPISRSARRLAEATALALLFIAACGLCALTAGGLTAVLNGRHGLAVEGLRAVAEALQRAQVGLAHQVFAAGMVGAHLRGRSELGKLLAFGVLGGGGAALWAAAPRPSTSAAIVAAALLGSAARRPVQRALRAAARRLPARPAPGRLPVADDDRRRAPLSRPWSPPGRQLTRDGILGLSAGAGAGLLASMGCALSIGLMEWILKGELPEPAAMGGLLSLAPPAIVMGALLSPLGCWLDFSGGQDDAPWRAWGHLPIPREVLRRAFALHAAAAFTLAACAAWLLLPLWDGGPWLGGTLAICAPAAALIYPGMALDRRILPGLLGLAGFFGMVVGAALSRQVSAAGEAMVVTGLALVYAGALAAALQMRSASRARGGAPAR